MSMTIGELVWKITGDKSGFNKSIQDSDKQAKNFGKTLKGIGKFIAGAFAVKAVSGFLKTIIKAGSDSKEVGQKFGVVFRGITKEANSMAKNLRDNYGLSITESKKLLSNTGDLLAGFGLTGEKALALSGKVQRLAADLASFSNVEGGVTFASEALTKGLFGETEQMKSLGIVINQNSAEFKNLVKYYQEARGQTLLQAKSMAILEMATEQSKNAIGDFARSQNSMANIQRRISARLDETAESLGQKLLPGLENAGLAFLEISKDGTVFSDALGAIFENISAVLSGISLVILKFKQWSQESDLDDNLEQQKELNSRLGETTKKLKELGLTQEEINKGQRNASNTNIKNSYQEAALLGELAKIQDQRTEAFKKGMGISDDAKTTEEALLNIRQNLAKSTDSLIDKREKEREATKKATAQNKKETDSIKEKTKETETFQDVLEKTASKYATGLGEIENLFSSISNLGTAIAENRMHDLDVAMERELEAAGLMEDSKEEQLMADIERAERKGDTETATEKKKQLERLKIEKKYAKKKAQIEYEVALMNWQFQLAIAIANVPLAIMQGMIAGFQLGPWGGPIFGAIAGAMAAIQVAAVAASKPKPPSFQMGGIVQGSALAGDTTEIQANAGEMILNSAQQRRLFEVAEGKQPGSGNITIYIGDEMIYDNLYNATKNGELIIDTRSLVSV